MVQYDDFASVARGARLWPLQLAQKVASGHNQYDLENNEENKYKFDSLGFFWCFFTCPSATTAAIAPSAPAFLLALASSAGRHPSRCAVESGVRRHTCGNENTTGKSSDGIIAPPSQSNQSAPYLLGDETPKSWAPGSSKSRAGGPILMRRRKFELIRPSLLPSVGNVVLY